MQDIYKIFDKKIGTNRISACLALCGYTEFKHFVSFNAESLANMEKYIGKVCFFMKKEERKKYIDEIFIDNPKEFIFSPRFTDEILKIVSSIKDHLEKNSSDFQENSIIDITNSSDIDNNEMDVQNNSNLNFNSDYKLFPKAEKLEYSYMSQSQLFKPTLTPTSLTQNKISLNHCYSNSESEIVNDNESERLKSFYAKIKEKSSTIFRNCHLEPYIDFEVLFYDVDDVLYNSKAYFICKLCSDVTGSKPGLTVRFDLSYKRNIIFKNIKIHLQKHFRLLMDDNTLKITDGRKRRGKGRKLKYKKK